MGKFISSTAELLLVDLSESIYNGQQLDLAQSLTKVIPAIKLTETTTENEFLALLERRDWDFILILGRDYSASLVELITHKRAAIESSCSVFVANENHYLAYSEKMAGFNLNIFNQQQAAIKLIKSTRLKSLARSDFEKLNMLSSMADLFDEAVLSCDPTGEIIYHNQKVGYLFFAEYKELVESNIKDLLAGLDYPLLIDESLQINKPSQFFRKNYTAPNGQLVFESYFSRPNGTDIFIELSVTKVVNRQYVFYLFKAKDISYRLNRRKNLKLKANQSLLQAKIEQSLETSSSQAFYLSIVKIIDTMPMITGQQKALLILENIGGELEIFSNNPHYQLNNTVANNALKKCLASRNKLKAKLPYVIRRGFDDLVTNEKDIQCFCVLPLVSLESSLGLLLLPSTCPFRLTDYFLSFFQSLGLFLANQIILFKKNDCLNKLQKAIDESPLSVVMLNPEGIVEYVNHFARKNSGFGNNELIGQHVKILRPRITPAAIFDEAWARVKQGENWIGAVQSKRKSGEHYWEKCFIGPVLGVQNEISGFIVLKQDITQEKQQVEQINYLQTRDRVTGLANRALFLKRLNSAIENRNEQSSLVVVSMNISNFAQINRHLGYSVGDIVVKEVAILLKANLLPGDSIARVNGTGFYLLMTNIKTEQVARNRFKRLLQPFNQPLEIINNRVTIAFHSGAAIFPKHSSSPDELLLLADSARNTAKLKRNFDSFEFAANSDLDSPINVLNIEREITRAIQEDELILYYQLQVQLNQGKTNSCEALVRWLHPVHGLLSPVEFIPLLESSDLIVLLGKWVIETAFKQLISWRKSLKQIPQVAVNVSAKQISSDDFLIFLDEMLKKYPIKPSDIQFELTETAILNDPTTSISLLHKVKNMGFSLAIDDFGTGYSNLSYLKDLPVTKVKIDRCFVQNMTHNAEDAILCKLIIQISHALDFDVVAEGVETEGQLKLLKRLNCDIIQGYYFAKPLAAVKFSKLFRQFKGLEQAQNREKILLIVDDEAAVLSSLKRLLRKLPYKTLTASNPSEALDILAVNNATVVISDLVMPEMSGLQFLYHVSKIYPEVIRIMLTANIGIDGLSEALNSGAINKLYLKPWDDNELKNVVIEAFNTSETSEMSS